MTPVRRLQAAGGTPVSPRVLAPLARARSVAALLGAEARALGGTAIALLAVRAVLHIAWGATTAVSLAAFAPILAAASRGTFAWHALAVWAAAQFLNGSVNAADPLLLHLQDHAISRRRNAVLLDAVAAVPYSSFLAPEGLDRIERARRAAREAGGAYTAVIDQLNALAGTVSLAILLWSFSPLLPFGTALAVLPLARTRWKTGADLHGLDNADAVERRRADRLAGLQFDRESQRELRLLRAGPLMLRRWRRITARSERALRRATRAGLAESLPPLLAAGAALVATGGLLYALLRAGSLSPADFVTAALAVWAATSSQVHVAEDLARLRRSVLGLADIHRIPGIASPAMSRVRVRPPKEIRAEGVTYRYPTAAEAALRNVTCALRAGEHVALVGENGSGKTTLLLVLMGLLQPDAGTLWYGDRRLTGYDCAAPAVWSAVFQDFTRYGLSVAENVTLGDGRGGPAEDWLPSELAHVKDRPLGKEYSDGIALSGGQWQRVAIARALRRARNPGTWFALDEATSALDPVAEAHVLDHIWDELAGHGALMVSHRLGFARRADRILVLSHGAIVEDGPHAQLVRQGGVYQRLYTAQAAGFDLGEARG